MKLNYQRWPQEDKAEICVSTPVIIIPGLFGSVSNWRSFAKDLGKTCSVYVIDQRNHGRSPHANSHAYLDMVEDLKQFIAEQALGAVNLCGHSMGGKVAMLFALLYPEKVNKLVVLDIAPVQYQHSHAPFLDALLQVDLSTLKSRSEADRAVKYAIPDTATRLFLLQSLAGTTGQYYWRLNLPVLHDYMAQIVDFPTDLVKNTTCQIPTKFIRGLLSDYIRTEHKERIRHYFPQATYEGIDQAGHWLHVEQPKAVISAIERFIKDEKQKK